MGNDKMTLERFLKELRAPMYTWTAANARRRTQGTEGYHQGAETQMRNAKIKIDDLVLERAEEVKKERQSMERRYQPSLLGESE